MVLSKTEAVHLRVQDIDFEFKQITVRDGKGKKDRVTPLANNLIVPNSMNICICLQQVRSKW
jgi:integrase